MIAALWTATARFDSSRYSKLPVRLSIFPSKMMPTNSPLRLITGEPEFPPMMSAVITKSRGVERSILSFRCAIFAKEGIDFSRRPDKRICRGIGRRFAALGKSLAHRGIRQFRSADNFRCDLCRSSAIEHGLDPGIVRAQLVEGVLQGKRQHRL